MPHVVDDIFALYREKGGRPYGLEPLSQLQHALQCAQIAERFGASAAMITAALLHDYGHLVEAKDETLRREDEHTGHAALGARLLSRCFPPDVTEPIRLHVVAKRCLCATDPDYYQTLSQGSLITLKQQGGLLTAEECEAFLMQPYAKAALLLRRWDDMSKDPAAKTPDFEYFRCYLEEALRDRKSVAAV